VSIFMIRYSSYGSRNYRTPGKRTYLDPLSAEYRELQELRERVNKAEAAAAQRLKSPVKEAGVQKAPNHEVAGSWAPTKQRALCFD
jgi:hypothetical protein